MRPLVLSHYALVTALGIGRDATVTALRGAHSGLRPCCFETVDIPTFIGQVEGVEAIALDDVAPGFSCRNNRLARMALDSDGFVEAVGEAKARYGADRIGLVLGTSTSGIFETERAYRMRDPKTGALPASFDYDRTQNAFSVGRFVAETLGLRGPAAVLSAACATTAKVFGSAARMIAAGLCEAAVVGGADSLSLTTLYGFRSLELTAKGPCRPFDVAREGISIGEAAGFALLEKPDPDHRAGAIHLLGFGESSDAYHMSSPHPEGLGAHLAMERALASAGIDPSGIDYVNLHGTATAVGDAAEDRAIVNVFGTSVPCSSTKGHTGHTLGAAGIVEAIIASLCIEQNFMPGSPQTIRLDPRFRARFLLEGESGRLDRVMSNSFGFGGSNCSLILGRG